MTEPIDQGIDLDSVVARLKAAQVFTTVEDIEAATVAIEEARSVPPAAYVSVASETAEPNKLIGRHAQRVTVVISTLFCIKAYRRDAESRHALDRVKRIVLAQLVGWKPDGGEVAFEYQRFLMRGIIDGVIWGEVLTRSTYRISLPV